MEPKFSIIIPVYNSAKTIPQVLRAVLSQNCSEPFEVIAVDDGSTDDTAQIVRSFENVRYIHQANCGPAAARNAGAHASRGEVLFFTDSDCIPHPDWIERILPHLSESKVAAIAGSYGVANPSSLLAVCIHKEILYRHGFRLKKYSRAFGSYNVAIRRKVFEDIGGYNTRYRHASGEDNDLSYRILQGGYRIFFEPQAKVDHFHPTRLGKYLGEQYRHGYWRARMYLDHPHMARGDDYTFWKDALEVPLTFVAMVSLITMFIGALVHLSTGALALSLTVLGLLELVFAHRIVNSFRQRMFFAAVMFLRAFSRMAGFLVGAIVFLPARMRGK